MFFPIYGGATANKNVVQEKTWTVIFRVMLFEHLKINNYLTNRIKINSL